MDEPNYQITDSTGTVIGEIGATSDGDVVVEHAATGETATLGPSGLGVAQANIGAISGVDAQPHQPRYQSYKSDFSWQDISWEDKGGPIIDGSGPGDGEAAWPTVIHAASVLDNSYDDWYCYWSTHDRNYIALSTAPSPWGPWSYHGKVLSDSEGSQTASPSVVFDPERGRLNLYYHVDPDFTTGGAGKQYTKLATAASTGNGTSFTIQGAALDAPEDANWDGHERSYMSVVRRGKRFIGVYQGRDKANNIKGIGLCHSIDGETFVKSQSQPAWDNTQWAGYDPTIPQGGSPALSLVGGHLTIHYADFQAAEARALPYESADAALLQGGETVYTAPAWTDSGDTVVAQDFVSDGEYLYLVYFATPTDGVDNEIGVARAELGVDIG
ncbi:hypothetical protein [Halosimplex pelagicum]|uniref:Family 43 glycosylhydrolase n=1 Tax=Halosimplex pelagicum TaxID=869886 RepID=A0A7D5TSZ7_9EURY|nr:hypothetical protein [Halosimplex pelagicum]QLH80994.1 hypothetical protein HZS54_04795 [Halosimplex pelagicum]QLH82454.1 hypothetical protein HZS54_12890 [Halosimplex pelagicum]QLH82510.1 hypothetical protein HZS54_13195 [Halosimplex pelagicum]